MKVAIIGHREVERTEELEERLGGIIEKLICKRQADTFLFGSKSGFDDLCYEVVTRLRDTYSVKRIYVRAEFEYISDDYKNYLLSLYEETIYPEAVHGAGRAAYIKRNEVMIDLCDCLLTYYNDEYRPSKRNSGTGIAYRYATKRGKEIINAL